MSVNSVMTSIHAACVNSGWVRRHCCYFANIQAFQSSYVTNRVTKPGVALRASSGGNASSSGRSAHLGAILTRWRAFWHTLSEGEGSVVLAGDLGSHVKIFGVQTVLARART